MVLKVEYNPDLALWNITEFKNGKRKIEECIPEKLEAGAIYSFLKDGQKNFWLYSEIPLIETEGAEIVRGPIASIQILEVTHFMENGEVYTKGKYKILGLCDSESENSVISRLEIKK